MRRRQASHRSCTNGDEERTYYMASLWKHGNRKDVGEDRDYSKTFRRNKHQFLRAPVYRALGLVVSMSLFLAWTAILPLPFQTNRYVRNATVRMLATPINSGVRSKLSMDITFPAPISIGESISSPDHFFAKNDLLHDLGQRDFNNLHWKPLADHHISRAISVHDLIQYEKERENLLASIDEVGERERALHYEDYAPVHRKCQRNNWRDQRFLNCLSFHETSVLERVLPRPMKHDYDIEYTGHGYFRDSWIYRNGDDQFVLKKIRMGFDYDEDIGYQIHREAIIMERLTASPRIVNIYGHCATSIMSEPMLHEVTNDMVVNSRDDNYAGYIDQADLDKLQIDDVKPMNNLTNEQKLDLAIAMAESIAEIHGYEGGVIIHGDFHPYQLLSGANGEIKLNDFNNAEILEFDVEKQEYCKIYRCFGGTYRSPEEFRCIDSNEGMDTYSFGNSIYVLLTGLWPFYQYDPDDSEFVQDLLINNKEKPYVDPRYRNRSVIEAGLVEVMEKAWEWDLDKRESIFKRLQQLYELRDKVAN